MDPTNWLPTYPDVLPQRRTLRGPSLASQPPYSAAIFPVVDVLAGLTFLPSYPDQVPHTRTLREMTVVTTAATVVTAITPLSWLPTCPPWGPHRRLSPGGMPFLATPPPGFFVVIAQSLAWQARYPSTVPHRRLPTPAGLFWAIDPSIAAAGEPCVGLALDAFAAPTMLTQALTTPTLIEEGLGTASLIDEDLCP